MASLFDLDPAMTEAFLRAGRGLDDGDDYLACDETIGAKMRHAGHAKAWRVGIALDATGAGKVYRVVFVKIDSTSPAAWKRTRTRWMKDRDISTQDQSDGSVLVRRALTAHAFNKLRLELLGDAAEGPPITFGAVEPATPLTVDAHRLIRLKTSRRREGDLPITPLCELIASIAGWSIREDDAAFRITRDCDPWTAEIKEALPGAIVDMPGQANSREPVTIRRRGDAPITPDIITTVSMMVHVLPPTAKPSPPKEIVEGGVWTSEFRVGETEYRHPAIFLGHVWVAHPAWVVTAPSGATFAILRRHAAGLVRCVKTKEILDEPENVVEYDGHGFWRWAYREGLGDAADAVAASVDPATLEALLHPDDPATMEHTGICQICNRRQKLRDILMVDHGYHFSHGGGSRWETERAYGPREDSCYGVGYRPYEIATDAIATYLSLCLYPRRDGVQHSLDNLRSGSATLYQHHEDRKTRVVTTRECKPGDADYEDNLRDAIHSAELELRRVISDVTKMERRVAMWTRKPLWDEKYPSATSNKEHT